MYTPRLSEPVAVRFHDILGFTAEPPPEPVEARAGSERAELNLDVVL